LIDSTVSAIFIVGTIVLAALIILVITCTRSQRLLLRRALLARALEDQLRAIVEASHHATVAMRLDSDSETGSETWRIATVLGDLDATLPGPSRDSHVEADTASLGWAIDDLLDEVNRTHSGRERLIHPTDGQGGTRALHLAAEPVAPGLITLIVRDVTVEESAREARERAFAQRLSALAMNEHQIKTPLSAAAGWAELLAGDDIGLDATTKQHAAERVSTIIARTITAINEDIDELREQGRGGTVEHPSADTSLLLALSVHAFKAALGCDISLEAAGGLIAGCPPSVYRQVVDQLLENSAKYSPSGRAIRVATWREDDYIVTSITDEGLGIPQDVDIFEPYVRAAPALGPEGSGLGLHIVRTLVEQHAGSVLARRNPGDGSTFEVRLPAVAANPANPPDSG
jgi:signal transduction histidine kinase